MISIFRKLAARVKASRFLSNILSIASANLLSQAVLLATTPILTRIYTPENFGVAALFLTALRLTGSISTWRFDRTIPNATTGFSALILCCWGGLIAIVFSALATAVVYLEITYANIWSGSRVLGDWLYLLPIAICLTGAVQLGAAWFARTTHLLPFSRSIVVYTGVYIFVALSAGLFDLSESGLIVASVFALLGQVVTIVFYYQFVGYKGRFTRKRFCSSYKRHINVATTATGVTFINTLSLTAPVFLLAQVYAVSELGIYALMTRLITTPVGVLTKSLSISFWSRAAELGRENKIKELHQLYIRVCLLMGVPAVFVVVACSIGSYLVVPLLGSQWHDAGPILIAIIPFVVGMAIASPTNHLWVLKKQSFQFIADGTRLILMVVSVIAAHYNGWSFGTAVLLVSLSSLIGHLILVVVHIILHRSLMRSSL